MLEILIALLCTPFILAAANLIMGTVSNLIRR